MVDGTESQRVGAKVVEMTATMDDSWGETKTLPKVAWTVVIRVVMWAQAMGR